LNFLKAACAKSDATGVDLTGEVAAVGLLGVSTDALVADAAAVAVWLEVDARDSAPPADALSPDTSPVPGAFAMSAEVLARGCASVSAIVVMLQYECVRGWCGVNWESCVQAYRQLQDQPFVRMWKANVELLEGQGIMVFNGITTMYSH
jgi:hypothetical protein